MSEFSSRRTPVAFAVSMKPEVVAMARKIVATDSPTRRIRDVGSAAPRIDPAVVAEALGAEDTGITLGREGSPVSSFQVRVDLRERLRSSGRPSGGEGFGGTHADVHSGG